MIDNDYWASLAKRHVPDDEMNVLLDAENTLGPDWSSPMTPVYAFVTAIVDATENRRALEYLVVPVTLPAWGDFTQAATNLASIEDMGIGNTPTPAPSRPDVVYVKLLRHVTQNFQVTEEQPIFAAAVITLIHSDSENRWLIFGIGGLEDPDTLPHID